MQILSYPISERTPLYGGHGQVRLFQERRMDRGDTCNAGRLEIPFHCGTHIDAPYHFDPGGKTIGDFPGDFWRARGVRVCRIAAPEEGELIGPEHLSGEADAHCEALLLVTGWWVRREREEYALRGPGLRPDLPAYLRERFPGLRFLGMDIVSVSSHLRREEGRETHRHLLAHERPILPIEDMNLAQVDVRGYSELIVAPLLLEQGDGAPVTVFAY